MPTVKRSIRYLTIATVIALLVIVHRSGSNYGFALQKPPKLSMVKSSIDWSVFPPYHPPGSIKALPTGTPHPLPRVQHRFLHQSRADRTQQESRRQAVKAVFEKCWTNYKEHAWMRDELTPISGGAKDTFGGWAATLIDSLDTLWIMGLKNEYYEAVQAIVALDWAKTKEKSVNMFETTIRHLGGLLAAYDMSGDQAILDKAIELGNMLYTGFDTPNRMPGFWLDFRKARVGNLVADDHEPSASPCSLSLEFTRLSQLSGNPKYYDAIDRITALLYDSQNTTKLPGMWPTFFDMRNQVLNKETTFTLGALADSLYEYLPKMHALLGGLDPVYEQLFRGSAETIKKNLLFRPMLPNNTDVLFSGTAVVNQRVTLNPEGQHLGCFVGGMFALGGRLFESQEYIDIGAKVTRGCIYAYNAFPTGLMPEIFNMMACESLEVCEWDEERWQKERNSEHLPPGFTAARVPYYILRPEAIESVFLLYRITGLKEFQDAAWQMFESIQRVTETEFGNAGIKDVTVTGNVTQLDSMESFWLAETLKYFYLIFSPPDLISLDEYVFNTEAHPFKRPI